MQPFAAEIERVLESRSDRLLELARQAVALNPEADRTNYTDEEIEQFVHAFAAVLVESVNGSGRETRELLLETAIPALIADGQTVASLVGSSTCFGVLLADELAAAVSAEQRKAVTVFLAEFLGGYSADIVRAAEASDDR